MSEITLALEHPSLGCGEVIARYDLSEIQEKAYQQGRTDAIRDIRVAIANRVPSRPITKRAREVWEDKYWLLINLDKELEQMQKGVNNAE